MTNDPKSLPANAHRGDHKKNLHHPHSHSEGKAAHPSVPVRKKIVEPVTHADPYAVGELGPKTQKKETPVVTPAPKNSGHSRTAANQKHYRPN